MQRCHMNGSSVNAGRDSVSARYASYWTAVRLIWPCRSSRVSRTNTSAGKRFGKREKLCSTSLQQYLGRLTILSIKSRLALTVSRRSHERVPIGAGAFVALLSLMSPRAVDSEGGISAGALGAGSNVPQIEGLELQHRRPRLYSSVRGSGPRPRALLAQ